MSHPHPLSSLSARVDSLVCRPQGCGGEKVTMTRPFTRFSTVHNPYYDYLFKY